MSSKVDLGPRAKGIMSLSMEEKKALVSRFNMIDDTFFSKIVEDIDAAEELIQIILGNNRIKILKSEPQASIRNVGSKSVVLDLLCTDENGSLFNVEIQRNDEDNLQKRMRYYVSNIDTRYAERGASYQDLPDIFSIMISEFDIFKKGKTVYHIDRILRNDKSLQDNGIHELYINATGKDGGIIDELMEYMLNSNGYNEKFPRISKRVNYFKEVNSGVEDMCDVMKDITKEFEALARAEGMAKGIAEGMEKGIAAGMEKGIAEGRAAGRAEVLRVLGISAEEYEKKRAEAQQQ